MTRRVTLADVAARAGVSKTAASLVLNDRPGSRLSADVVGRVRAIAAELDYRPNPAARTLRQGRNRTIGFISDEVTITRYASAMIRGALDVAQRHEHTVLIAETGTNREGRGRAIQVVADQRPSGLIFALMGAKQIDVPAVVETLPVVVLNGTSSAGHPAVLPGEYAAGSQVAEVLLTAGHRRIGIIGLPPTSELDPHLSVTVGERIAGIRETLGRVGVDPVGITVPARATGIVWEPETGFDSTQRILTDHPEITGLICLNDRLAFGAYQAIQERGLRVPDDISVVSFDDDELAAYLRPPLTTARIPYLRMGEIAMAMALGLEATPGDFPSEGQPRTVPMPIQHRGSVGPPR